MWYIEKKIISKNYIYLVTFILICTKFVFSQNNISYENSWAVVIGINDYQNETITDLNYAVSDAQDIGEMLIEYYDFPDEKDKGIKTGILNFITCNVTKNFI